MAITVEQWEQKVSDLQDELKEAIEILTEIGTDLSQTGTVSEKIRLRASEFTKQRAFTGLDRPKSFP